MVRQTGGSQSKAAIFLTRIQQIINTMSKEYNMNE